MNVIDTKRACDAYYAMVTSDWHKADLLLKVMDALICGGSKRDQLERLFSDTDSAGIVRAASFRLAGDDDPLVQAIRSISD